MSARVAEWVEPFTLNESPSEKEGKFLAGFRRVVRAAHPQ